MLIKALILSFLISLLLGFVVWKALTFFKMWQPIKEYGPRSHFVKVGTPTMGGLSFILSFYLTLFMLKGSFSREAIFIGIAGILCSTVGIFDDIVKVRGGKDGIKAREKFFLQILFSLMCLFALYRFGFYNTEVYVPFIGGVDLSIFYAPFALFIFLACMNAVNITDGLDGLACGSSLIALTSFLLLSLWQGRIGVSLLNVILIGSLAGFFIYNRHPAKMFMGDVGSMFLGGVLASLGIILKVELLIVFIGGIFVFETLSVVFQMMSYKLRGKRLFLMSPIHHHFELKGWSERSVVALFWGIELGLSTLGLILYKFG